jgi:hypothetical protein
MAVFGTYSSSPKPYSFCGQPGYFTVPAGRSWYQMSDKNMQIWVSPNPLTKNSDGTVSGKPLYAADMNLDGTLVFQDQLANRKLGIDSPAPDKLSGR